MLALGRNYLMPAKKVPRARERGSEQGMVRNGVWDVQNAGSGISFPAGNGLGPAMEL